MRVLLLFLFILLLAPVYAQDLITSDNTSGIKLIIDSDPADAEVYIDGQLYGRTPLNVKDLSPGTYEIKIKKEGFDTFVQKVECPALGYKEIFSVLSGKYALLNIESTVEGSEVFVGDSLLGTTPLHKVHIPLGKHTIMVRSKDYFDWSKEINAAPTLYSFKSVMKYKYGYVSLSNALEGSEVLIDDKKVDVPLLNNYKLEMGNHKIEINHPAFNGPIEEDLLVGSETRTSMKMETGYFSFSSFLKSLFVPGLGQYQDNSKIKGAAVFSGALITGILFVNSAISNSKKVKDYNKAQTDYSLAGTIAAAYYAHGKLVSAYDAAKKSNKSKNINMGAFLAVYAYNIIDAIVFHSSGRSLTITQEKPAENSFNLNLSLAF